MTINPDLCVYCGFVIAGSVASRPCQTSPDLSHYRSVPEKFNTERAVPAKFAPADTGIEVIRPRRVGRPTGEIVHHMAPSLDHRADTETVIFRWDSSKGHCLDCGIPAAYTVDRDGSEYIYCSPCAAVHAADGEPIYRLFEE